MSFNIDNLFQLLPSDVMINLLTKWLNMRDVCIFDTAICNKKNRLIYLNYLKSNITIFDGIYLNSNLICSNWIIAREISVKKLKYNSYYTFNAIDINIMKNIIKLSPKLQSYELNSYNYNNQFSLLNNDDYFSVISSNCKQLRDLKFYRCGITDKAIIKISENLLNLQYLNLAFCEYITDYSIVKIARNLTNLEHLDISGCVRITDIGLIKISENLAKLTDLHLNGNSKITDDSVIKIAENLKSLQHLNLLNCYKITDVGIIKIINNLTLKHLGVYNCDKVTEDCIIKLTKNCVLYK
jgi:hypothetical protein